MMNYPYPALLSLLQVYCTPDEYLHARAKANRLQLERDPAMYVAYWRLVPEYTYACCPICKVWYREPADTYSLSGWRARRILFDSLFVHGSSSLLPPRCPHWLGVHQFINFHGVIPTEVDWFENTSGEVPYMTRQVFHEDILTYAVLHALPICRVEHDTFVPRYTQFSLTYFSQDPQEVLRRVYEPQMALMAQDREYYPALLEEPSGRFSRFSKQPQYELANWAARGQLGWLDAMQPDLPLCIGPGRQLPLMYQNIAGARRAQLWRKGRLQYTL